MENSISFQGCLFDLDGTLIDSMPSVHRAWSQWAISHGMEPESVLNVIHGRPARESLSELLPNKPKDIIDKEFRFLEQYESTDTDGTTIINGAKQFLHQLDELSIPWGIVTSGTLPVATARLKAAGIRKPEVLITPELINQGKPHPEPYLLGAEKIQVSIDNCLVFEDAPAGVQAGIAAGSQVIAILSHMRIADLPNASAYIHNYTYLTVTKESGTAFLTIKTGNQP